MRRLASIAPLLIFALARCSSSSNDGGGHDAGGGIDAAPTGTDASAPDAGNSGLCDGVAPKCVAFTPDMTDLQIRNEIVRAIDGTTFVFAAGTFHLGQTINVPAIANLTVKGAGLDQTVLDFKAQPIAGPGFMAQNLTHLTFEDFAVVDTQGNGFTIETATTVTFMRVKTSWTSTNSTSHGAYGVYPVKSKDVLVDGCMVEGASDTGIYVGQSKNIIVRNNTARFNVAGIEIENSFGADVHDNDSENNTAGILVFDLPDLQQKGGHNIRVFNNTIKNNNTLNFAPQSTIVHIVPAGTGFFVMANHEVEVFGNHIEGNETGAIAVISYYASGLTPTDTGYYPWPYDVHIHDNMLVNNATAPDQTSQFGMLLASANGAFTNMTYPTLVYDGIVDPTHPGSATNRMTICFESNGDVSFANLHLDRLNMASSNLSMILTQDLATYTCTLQALPPITIP